MAVTPSESAPVTITPDGGVAVTLANLGMTVDPQVAASNFQHSGNLFPSLTSIMGAMPMIEFQTTPLAAYNAIGLGIKKLSACVFYLATFADFEKSSGTDHEAVSLATSATACAYITQISASDGSEAVATVRVHAFSSDGMTHPWSPGTAALPTLASEPTLHTVGPFDIGGAQTDGVRSISLQNNVAFTPQRQDGELYPQTGAYYGGTPTMQIEFMDPAAAQSALGYTGSQATTHAVHLRQITSNVVTTTTMSFTTTGRAIMGARNDQTGQISELTISLVGLSTTTDHPWTVNVADSVA